MRYALTLLVFLFVPTLISYTQDDVSKPRKNEITFNLTRLILLEARFGYERQLSNSHIVRASFGIQFPTNSESFPYRLYVPYYYPVSRGVYVSSGYNYFINKRSRL